MVQTIQRLGADSNFVPQYTLENTQKLGRYLQYNCKTFSSIVLAMKSSISIAKSKLKLSLMYDLLIVWVVQLLVSKLSIYLVIPADHCNNVNQHICVVYHNL